MWHHLKHLGFAIGIILALSNICDKSFVLSGTAIWGSSRHAILQEGKSSGATGAPGRSAGPMRYKIGDVIEGFRLSEIRDKNVVFSKGSSRVELALDYFRKIEARSRPTTAQRGISGAAPVSGQLIATTEKDFASSGLLSSEDDKILAAPERGAACVKR